MRARPALRRGGGLPGYVLRRLLQGVGVLWASYTIAYVVLYLLPSDPVRIMLAGSGTEFANPDPAAVAALEREYGFDRPVLVQYVTSLGKALTGDLGTSIQRSDAVTSMLADALGRTTVLAGLAFALALVGGLLLAVPAAFTRRPSVRQALLGVPSVAVSVPTFWTGLLLTQVVSFQLGWVDVFDPDGFGALLLPAITLAVPTSAYIAQVLSKSLLATLREPYTEVIRSHGASEARIVLVSALRNASLPLLTMIGVIIGNLFAGSVVVETVFARDGIGNMTFQAVTAQDIPVVMGVVLLAAAIFVVISLVVDLVYPLLDPRVVVRDGDTPPAAAPVEAQEVVRA